MANTLSRGVQAQKLSVAVDEAKCVITEVIRVMNLEWLLPTYKHVTFIAALNAVRKLQREQHIPSSSTIFIRFSKEGNFSDVRKKFEKMARSEFFFGKAQKPVKMTEIGKSKIQVLIKVGYNLSDLKVSYPHSYVNPPRLECQL